MRKFKNIRCCGCRWRINMSSASAWVGGGPWAAAAVGAVLAGTTATSHAGTSWQHLWLVTAGDASGTGASDSADAVTQYARLPGSSWHR